VLPRKLVIEEALTHWGLLRQKKERKEKIKERRVAS
jgi:hypothetical protein